MKRKNKLKKIIISLVAVVLVAGIGVGIFFYTRSNTDPVGVYAFMDIGMTEYWGDSKESYGSVKADKIQAVYLSDTQTVEQVLVQTGDSVHKGDVLLQVDTTLSSLSVERKRLEVEQLNLQLKEAQARLSVIKGMVPMVIPEPKPVNPNPDRGQPLEGAWQLLGSNDGSAITKPLICWINGETELDDALFTQLLEQTHAPLLTYYVVFKATEGNLSKGENLIWQGMQVTVNEEGYTFRLFDASGISDPAAVPEEPEEEVQINSGYTASEIAQMRSEQEKTIRELSFNIKMAEADYKIMKAEMESGQITADFDGVVMSALTAEEAALSGQPIVKVSGGGGYYIEGSVSELDRSSVTLGQEVTVNDWYSGTTLVGTIQAVSDYPVSNDNGFYYGDGNPNASYYPFTVYVDGSEDMMADGFVTISYAPDAGTSNGIYLENAFLRTEYGQSYVYVRGEDGLLEKRNVRTGKSLWGSYTEILSGVTAEDYLAFPYGKTVKEGAATVESDLSVLYGY